MKNKTLHRTGFNIQQCGYVLFLVTHVLIQTELKVYLHMCLHGDSTGSF